MVGWHGECAQITVRHMRHEAVEMTGRNNPQTSVVDADVIERQEAGQELAGDTGVPAVLVPRYLLLGARSLGQKLFADEPDVGPEVGQGHGTPARISNPLR